MESQTLQHLADVALSCGGVPSHRVESTLTSPTHSIRMVFALLARFGLAVTKLVPQPTQQPAQFQTPQWTQQSSPPLTIVLSEREPRQNPFLIPQTFQGSVVDGVRFTFPATGQTPERTRICHRSQQLPRRLHSPLGNPSGIMKTATCN